MIKNKVLIQFNCKILVTLLWGLQLSFNVSFGQTVEWWPEGSESIYPWVSFFGGGVDTFRVEGDTLIEEKRCVIVGNGDPVFQHILFYDEKEDQVLRFLAEKFRLLYDFSASEGDTISIPIPFNDGESDEIIHQLVVDSVGVVSWNDQLLRWYSTYVANPEEDEWDFSGTVVEKLGHLTRRYPLWERLDGTVHTPLTEYREPSGLWVKLSPDLFGCYTLERRGICEYFPVTDVSLDSYSKSEITVGPVPTTSFITVSSQSSPIVKVGLSNMSGKELFTREYFDRKKFLDINCGDLLPGIYLLQITTSNVSTYRKIVIH